MSTRTLLYLLIGAMMQFLSCNSAKTSEKFDFERLQGSWTSVDTVSSQVEEWEQIHDSSYVGRGYVLEEGDTTFFESLELRKERGEWTYLAKVQQLSGMEIVPFRLNKQSRRMVEFVNAQHDFPKKIGYELLTEDELQAYIEGPRNGQNIRIMFDFKRN